MRTEEDFILRDPEWDKELYRKMGYNKPPGFLRPVRNSGERAPVYQSWDDLVDFKSPWAPCFRNPSDWFEWLVSKGMEKQDNKNVWIVQRALTRKKIQAKLDDAEAVRLEVNIGEPIMWPEMMVAILPSGYYEASDIHMLGEVLMTVMPERKTILGLVNSRPWGQTGGLQKLADILCLPLQARASTFATQEFLPSLSAARQT